jgi:hypothetical protein
MTRSSTATPFDRRPTLASGAVGIGAGTLAIALVAGTAVQRLLLTATVVGVVSFALGGRLWQRDRSRVGAALALCGCLLGLVATGYAASQPSQFSHRLELLPGILGLWVLAAALLPLRFRWSRLLVDAGTGLMFVAVLTSGIVRGASTAALVVAAAATLLAWDVSENAVSMGGQIGSDETAATSRAEFVHAGMSGGVAVTAVVVVLGVARLGIDGLPFAALVALLVAAVTLTLVFHR